MINPTLAAMATYPFVHLEEARRRLLAQGVERGGVELIGRLPSADRAHGDADLDGEGQRQHVLRREDLPPAG